MDNGAEYYRRFREDGDENGLAEIIRDYQDGLTRYLNGIVGNIVLAEELCEDTFVLLGTKKPKDKGKGSFRTWLYTIGRNLALDDLRRQKRRRELPIEDAEQTAAPDAVEESYCKKEQGILVQRAMRSLLPEQRQVLSLVYFDGMTSKEAAAVMHKSTRSIESLLYRAKRSLKKALEKEGFDYENT